MSLQQGDVFGVAGLSLQEAGADRVSGAVGHPPSTIEFWPLHGMGLVQAVLSNGHPAAPVAFRLAPTSAVPIEILDLYAGTLLPEPIGARFRVASRATEPVPPSWRHEVLQQLLVWLPLWKARRTHWAWLAAVLARAHRRVLTPSGVTLTPSPLLQSLLGTDWFAEPESVLVRRQQGAAMAWAADRERLLTLGLSLGEPLRSGAAPEPLPVPYLLAPHERDRAGKPVVFRAPLSEHFDLLLSQHGHGVSERGESVAIVHRRTGFQLGVAPDALLEDRLVLDSEGPAFGLGHRAGPATAPADVEDWLLHLGELSRQDWLTQLQRLTAAASVSLAPGLFEPLPPTSPDHWVPEVLPRWRREQQALQWWRGLLRRQVIAPETAVAALAEAVSPDLRTVLLEAGYPLTEAQLDDPAVETDPAHPVSRRWLADLASRPDIGTPELRQRLARLALQWAQAWPRLAAERQGAPWEPWLQRWMQEGRLPGEVAVPLLRAEGLSLEELLALVPDALVRADWLKSLLSVGDRAWREGVIRLIGRAPAPMVPTRPRVPYAPPVPVPGSRLDVRG